jgi:hypothetical protein
MLLARTPKRDAIFLAVLLVIAARFNCEGNEWDDAIQPKTKNRDCKTPVAHSAAKVKKRSERERRQKRYQSKHLPFTGRCVIVLLWFIHLWLPRGVQG